MSRGGAAARALTGLLLLATASCAGGVAGAAERSERQPAPQPIVVHARPVPLSNADPASERVGRLSYLGGVALSAADARFGGLSGLVLTADCRRFSAVSDRGHRFEGALVFDPAGRFEGIADVRAAALQGPDGRPLTEANGGVDAESLARTAKGAIVVGFEGRHRLWRYDRAWSLRPVALAVPPELATAPGNGGIEALTVLKDGRLLAFAEELEVDGGVRGWLGDGRRPWTALTLLTGAGFRPTAAATLPDGRVLVLERRILPPAARLRLFAASGLVAGARLEGEEIARLDGALTVDNMEALDACRGADGGVRLVVGSDDNFSPFQRTLLLAFRLDAQ